MITAILIFFTLLALAVDYYILRRNIPKIKWLRIAFTTQALLLDVGIMLYLVLTVVFRPRMGDGVSVAMLWVMLIFMMSFASKIIFALFSLTELGLSRVFKRRFHALTYIGFSLIVITLSVMIYGTSLGRNDLRVENITIESDELPDSFDGFRIAQFSDAHLGNLGHNSELISDLVDKINDLNPDLIVQSGDLVNIHAGELDEWYMSQFKRLEAPVYSVFGNHDLAYYIHEGQDIVPEESIEELIAKQDAMGWKLMRNENTWLRRGSDSIALGGVVYPQDGRFGVRNNRYGGSNLSKTFENVPDSAFSTLISHTPSLFDSIPRTVRPNLTVSGHVHSMQMKFTIGSWRWSPAKWLYPMWSGLYNVDGYQLYINDGIGYALYPMRIGVRPEITLYTLRVKS